ncbi:STY1053 family phage-associated protein [Pantoea ananatis]|jgi:uncharacterized coiled-coil protein SlyX|uniref:STY1053 family phage-associated protein n=1 Tax=Pantoea ananas TaxID=553 RepID=UPI003FA45515
MAKEKVEILVHTPFTLNTAKGEIAFLKGRHKVDPDIAKHWFVVAHSDQTGGVESGGDTELQAEIDSLKSQLEDKVKNIGELNEQIAAKDKALEVLTKELETLKAAKEK